VQISCKGTNHQEWSRKTLKRKFGKYARWWTADTNLKLNIDPQFEPADIRVKIRIVKDERPDYVCGDSMVGTDALTSPPNKHTMELVIGYKATKANTRGLMLHEFGHALGFDHEHVHPNRPLKLKRHPIYKAFRVYGKGYHREREG
jgi:hypothetical protein